jgi:NAD(P)-dependent dehydrogenase (short-subunit alcohol dehydrogenase family)
MADQVEAALAQLKREFGALDALVNNAGTAVFKPALDTTLAEFQRTMDVNLRARS